MPTNKFLPLILLGLGICCLGFGVWLYKANEKPKTVSLISVEVGGFVAAPGVYKLAVGSRVSDLLEVAGGLTKEVQNINRVAVLKDGQKIYIK